MTAICFVDTNVLVYFRDATEKAKQPRASRWMETLWRSRAGRTSAQVLNEYYVTVTGKLEPGLPREVARMDVQRLLAWRPVSVDGDLVRSAFGEQDRFGFSFWDSLIVAAARTARSDFLLTEDLQDGQDLGGLIVIDPFTHPPPD